MRELPSKLQSQSRGMLGPDSRVRLPSTLGEGGMAIHLANRPKNLGALTLQLPLPGTERIIECSGEVAWENPGRQLGLRFADLTPEMRDRLKAWLESCAP